MKSMQVKEITPDHVYAIRIPAERDDDGWTVHWREVQGIVVNRIKGERKWDVMIVDGDTTSVQAIAHAQFAGTWDDHIAEVSIEAAGDAFREIAIEQGWADDHMGTSVMFGGPVGPTVDGRIQMHFTAEQAQWVIDAMRDRQIAEHTKAQ
jgi:hypothetical protein